jgi:hypothetical protein
LNAINPESKEIIMMPEATLIKHIHDIFEKKFEYDEKLLKQIKTSQY